LKRRDADDEMEQIYGCVLFLASFFVTAEAEEGVFHFTLKDAIRMVKEKNTGGQSGCHPRPRAKVDPFKGVPRTHP
jgi:hypothetical protein